LQSLVDQKLLLLDTEVTILFLFLIKIWPTLTNCSCFTENRGFIRTISKPRIH
jgi:hypothetical protein